MISRNREWRYTLIHYRPDPDLDDLCAQKLLGVVIYPHESDRTATLLVEQKWQQTVCRYHPEDESTLDTFFDELLRYLDSASLPELAMCRLAQAFGSNEIVTFSETKTTITDSIEGVKLALI
jgi:hypothetical protein